MMRSRDPLETSNGSVICAPDTGEKPAALSSALDAMDHGLAVWSDGGKLLFWNAACASFFSNAGVHLSEGQPLEEFLAALARSGLLLLFEDEELWIEQEQRLFAIGGASDYTCIDGRIFRNERWSLPDASITMLLREITEERRNEASLEKARDDANQADKTKSRFLRAANHDLRQPLASLKILIYNCMMTDDEEHRSDLLHAMDISVAIMEDLLGALLNIGQLGRRAGQTPHHNVPAFHAPRTHGHRIRSPGARKGTWFSRRAVPLCRGFRPRSAGTNR